MARNDSYKLIEKLEHLRNVREFFDNFKRVKQKVRVTDEYPSVNQLIRLEMHKKQFKTVYGDIDGAKKYIKNIESIDNLIIDQKLEYSISIDGQGRKEFMKAFGNPRQKEEDEKEKDIIDKLADTIG